MNTTEVTVVGNVVGAPSRVRTQNGSVTNFRLAATERRYDSTVQGFVDGATFFVDVECWNELGGNVSHSVSKGDPVVVRGALRTHEWESDTGRRSRPQIRAEAVGFNLARGTGEFRRTQRAAAAPAPEPRPVAEDGEDAVDGMHPEGAVDAGERDYDAPVPPLYELDPDTAAAMAHASPGPALH